MKAITCTQCGALIKRISLKDKFAFCDYCEAKILLEENKDRIVEISDKKASAENNLTPWEQYRENVRKASERARQYDEPYMNPQEPDATTSKVFSVIVILVIVFIVIGGFIGILASFSSRPANVVEKTTPRTIASPVINYPTPTPLPQINYQVRVQWDGSNDMEHFENPQIDTSKLPTTTENELKKTVFKNRGVQVKITIDTTGEVTSAEGISGHPILKEAAVNAAKKTLFNSRQKPTTRILTYYFRLITE